MALSAAITDGKISSGITEVDKTSQKIVDNGPKKAGGNLDKDAFLQLLVAQMQYQDPLEPTDNTQYVSQLASFSSLEQMQNMSSSLESMSAAADLQRASLLVGQFATVDTDGQGSYLTGKVDSVEFKDGEAKLSIGGKTYPFANLYEAIDAEYLDASTIAAGFQKTLKGLPSLELLTSSEKTAIEGLRNVYDNLNAYQKSFITDTDYHTLETYEKRLAEILGTDEE